MYARSIQQTPLLDTVCDPGLAVPTTIDDWRHEVAALSTPAAQLPPAIAPERLRPVVVIGAGSIVRDAHGPAYEEMGLRRLAIYDQRPDAAEAIAQRFRFEHRCATLAEAIERASAHEAVFDLALPPDAVAPVLAQLPVGSGVLIQKPLGKSLSDALDIATLVRERQLVAAVNFQLPFSPQIVGAFAALRRGLIGSLLSARVELDLRTNWSLWEFLLQEPRIEILLHSIHYLSLCAHYFGPPQSVASTQRGDPEHPILKARDVCSTTHLGYVTPHRPFDVLIDSNHLSARERSEWRSELVLEGTLGTIVARIADNLDYPNGVDDMLTLDHHDFGRERVSLVGNRFPWAFVATMTHLQQALLDGRAPDNSLELGLLTMRMAEACYQSNADGGVGVSLRRGEPASG